MQLLGVLDKIVDAEDLEFCMRQPSDSSPAGTASAAAVGASSVVVEGLTCLMPLLTKV